MRSKRWKNERVKQRKSVEIRDTLEKKDTGEGKRGEKFGGTHYNDNNDNDRWLGLTAVADQPDYNTIQYN